MGTESRGITLDQFQHWMQAVINHTGSDEEAFASRDAERYIKKNKALNFVLPSRTLEPMERIGIYRRMYIYRLVEVLESDFTGVAHFVGDEAFYELVNAYVRVYPSRSYHLNPLSNNFPEFVRTTDIKIRRRDFVYDLARLELAVSQACDAEGSTVLTKDDIAAVPPEDWETARLEFVHGFALLACRYPVNDYLQSVIENDHDHDTRRRDTWVAVYRQGYRVFRQDMPRAAYGLLNALYQGKPLGEAIAEAIERSPRRAASLQRQIFEWFQDWVAEGYFRAVVKGD